ncbi:MAG: hypothetical protein E4G99_12210, partial [Anaerolineales bacterium]
MSADTCPICNEPQLVRIQPGVLECHFCKSQIVNGQIICPACRRANAIGLENCSGCDEPLTVFSAVMSRQTAGRGSQRLEQLKGQAGVIQVQAEKHSQARMADFQEVDLQRIESERKASEQQRLHDRLIYKYTAISLGIFLLVVAIVSLIVR